ncbi:MAG: DUF4397 domain-containing protein [Chloroflexi bacterium]|nr:DUF4397 domain-containing protein [Chloroflexota bacterium]
MRKHLITLALILALTAVLIPSAAAQDGGTPEPEDMAGGDNAYVRFAHFAQGVDASDVYLNQEASDLEPLEFGGLSEWRAVPAGTTNVALAPAGGTIDNATLAPADYELAAGQWVTIFVVGAADGAQAVVVEEDHSDTAPGVANSTFVNALAGTDTAANFLRDDVVFVSELMPIGNETEMLSSTSIPMDAGTYTFGANETYTPENVIGSQPDTKINETSHYLFVALGGDSPQLFIDETPLYEVQLLTGELEAPGTLIEAARGDDLLGPFADALDAAGLTEMLSGAGPYTVFATVDFAVDEIRAQYGDGEELANYLRGFIVEGDLKFTDVMNSESLTSVGGQTLTVSAANGNGYINDTQILEANIAASNGTIHIIGLSPEFGGPAPGQPAEGDMGAAATEEAGMGDTEDTEMGDGMTATEEPVMEATEAAQG